MNRIEAYRPSRVSRRAFCRAALVVAAAPIVGSAVAAPADKAVKFFKNLGPGHIGVRANQKQALEYAVKYGFEGITPNAGDFPSAWDDEIAEWVALMKEKGIRYGAAGLPTSFRGHEQAFNQSLAELPAYARLLEELRVDRVATWIPPGHNSLTYLQNFKLHEARLRDVANILKDHNIRLGLEFVGPRTSRSRSRYPFICTQQGMMELVTAIGTGNVGLLLDSWHWYTSHGTVEELRTLSGADIVHVHLNDAPGDIDIDRQMDNRRQLPVTSGVIDMKGFLNTLVAIGYDGPAECEPFDQQLRDMDDDPALKKTIDALNRAWDLIDA